jgi:DNA-binding CsgD family transcriptional regulator
MRRGRAVVPQHIVHAVRLPLSTNVPCVLVPETDIRRRAELLDNLAQQLDFVDQRDNLLETCSAAVALRHELGDTRRECDSLLRLSENLWWLCRGADSEQAANALLTLAEPLGPSPQLAKAYNTLAPFASQVAGDAAHAAELWDRLGYRYEAALALLDTKEEAPLRESLARLSDLGAEAAARLVLRTMRDLGIRSIPAGVRTATRKHPRGLTRREQEILELLSQGRSDDEIAATLFISVRTVEHHVSAILGKLGATTRKGAAKEAWRLGLADPYRVSVARNLGSRLANMGVRLPSVVDHALLRSFADFRPKEEPCRSTWMSTASMVQ